MTLASFAVVRVKGGNGIFFYRIGSMTETFDDIRTAVQALCNRLPGDYWRRLDAERAYPTDFVNLMTEAGYLAALIPEEFGGSGLGLGAAAAILEEVHKSGGNGAACHAQMYVMGTILRYGSAEQKDRVLPAVASGKKRLQAFAVTEPSSGTDTSRIRTMARREADTYVIDGQKIWTSRAEHSDLMLLLARTAPRAAEGARHDGMSIFLVDIAAVRGQGLEIHPIETMINHHTTEVFFDGLRVPAANLIGSLVAGGRSLSPDPWRFRIRD